MDEGAGFAVEEARVVEAVADDEQVPVREEAEAASPDVGDDALQSVAVVPPVDAALLRRSLTPGEEPVLVRVHGVHGEAVGEGRRLVFTEIDAAVLADACAIEPVVRHGEMFVPARALEAQQAVIRHEAPAEDPGVGPIVLGKLDELSVLPLERFALRRVDVEHLGQAVARDPEPVRVEVDRVKAVRTLHRVDVLEEHAVVLVLPALHSADGRHLFAEEGAAIAGDAGEMDRRIEVVRHGDERQSLVEELARDVERLEAKIPDGGPTQSHVELERLCPVIVALRDRGQVVIEHLFAHGALLGMVRVESKGI